MVFYNVCILFFLIMIIIKFLLMLFMLCLLIKIIVYSGMFLNVDNYSLVISYLYGLYLNLNSFCCFFYFYLSDFWLVIEKWIVCKVLLFFCRLE